MHKAHLECEKGAVSFLFFPLPKRIADEQKTMKFQMSENGGFKFLHAGTCDCNTRLCRPMRNINRFAETSPLANELWLLLLRRVKEEMV